MANTLAETEDLVEAARGAGLRYVSDQDPGLRRRRTGKGFTYLTVAGERLRDPAEVSRIKSLAIPPAWTDVWICPSDRGHIQATGRDARGRKQYRYHDRWREVRDRTKFERMAAFGKALPAMREKVQRDLALPGLPREKVLAAVVSLLESTSIRVGNPAYARDNGSYGLTTLRDRHVNVFGSRLRFRFRGKGGKLNVVDLTDRRLAAVVKRCQDLPGEELFQYVDDAGGIGTVGSEDVNAYLHDLAGEDFTAKDFRTWNGSLLAARALIEEGEFGSESEGKHKVVNAVKEVAHILGNTPTVCRACYIHPFVIQSYVDGDLEGAWEAAMRRRPPKGLQSEEAALLRLLESSAARAA
jgi:DNA topoisomerase-1